MAIIDSATQTYQNDRGETVSAKTGQVLTAATQAPDPFAPVNSSSASKVSPVTSISTEQGMQALTKAKATETRLTPPPPQPTSTPTTTTPPPSTKVTLINPNTEQSVTFDSADINRSQIESYMNGGYQVAEASGAIPSWLSPSGTAAPKETSELDQAKSELDAAKSKLTVFDTSHDPALTSLLAGITSQWDTRITQMEGINKSRNAAINTTGIRLGSRYTGGAGGVFGGIISEEERQGVDRIAQLQNEKQQALAEAKTAYDNNQWTKYAKLVDLAQSTYDDQLAAVTALNKASAEQATKLQEQEQKTKDAARLSSIGVAVSDLMKQGVTNPGDLLQYINTHEDGSNTGANLTTKELGEMLTTLNTENPMIKTFSDIAKSAKQNGAPPEVIQAIFDSKDPAGAYNAAGSWLENGSGVVGEYQYYKREAERNGQTPIDFNSYQNVDANRKARVAAAINAAGLTAALTNTALKLSDDYEQRSKDFYQQRDAYNRIVASSGDPSPAGDLALIFNYMKVLDPGSTVREGEFANAQNAGSAWQTLGAQYNKIVNGQRLTASQRTDFVKRAGTLFNSAKKQQDSVADEFKSRAKKYGVPDDLVVRDTASTMDSVITDEAQAKAKLQSVYAQHKDSIDALLRKNPSISNADILQVLGLEN